MHILKSCRPYSILKHGLKKMLCKNAFIKDWVRDDEKFSMFIKNVTISL